MSFLRRLLGGEPGTGTGGGDATEAAGGPTTVAEDETERDRRLLREDAERLDDELIQRQMRYADRSWVPAAQGSPRRADDPEGDEA